MAELPSSPLIEAALETAIEAHAGQVRSGSGGMPYSEHPVAVAELLAERGWDEDVLAAALLHDVVEASGATVAELRERFGADIAGLVETLSDDESITDYAERKREHRDRVAAAGEAAKAIYGADKLTNVRTLRRAYGEQGEAVAAEFKAPLDVKVVAWEEDLEMLRERAAELDFLDALGDELSRLAADRAATSPRSDT